MSLRPTSLQANIQIEVISMCSLTNWKLGLRNWSVSDEQKHVYSLGTYTHAHTCAQCFSWKSSPAKTQWWEFLRVVHSEVRAVVFLLSMTIGGKLNLSYELFF